MNSNNKNNAQIAKHSKEPQSTSEKPLKKTITLGVIGGVVSVVAAIINYCLGFPAVLIAGLRSGSFGDLYGVLLGIDCFKNIGFSVYEMDKTDLLGSSCTTFYYGSPLLTVGSFLHLDTSFLGFIAWTLIISVAFLIGFIFINLQLQKSILGKFLFISAILLSPPLSLLFERANLDLFIFLGVAAAAYFYRVSSPRLSFLIIGLTTIMKFYTAPLIAILLTMSWKQRRNSFLFLISFAAVASAAADLVTRVQNPWRLGEAQFGSSVFTHYLELLGIGSSKNLATLLGGFVIVIFAIVIQYTVPNLPKPMDLNDPSALNRISAWSLAIFLICFFAGYNFDYRLIFLAAAAKAVIPPSAHSRNQNRLLTVLVILAMWGSINLGSGVPALHGSALVEIIQALGDLAVTAIVIFTLSTFIKALRTNRFRASVN